MRKDWIEIEYIVEQRSEKVDPSVRPDLSFVGMDCIKPHFIRPTFYYRFSDFKSLGNYYQEGDILYGRLRPYLNKLMVGNSEGSASGEFIILKPSKHVYPKFLMYHLHSRDFVAFANKQVSGDRPRIKYDQIKKYTLKFFPLPEQRAIVAKIEQLFSELDNGIANLKAAKDKLDIYRQAVLKKAFEGELTKKWREQQTDLPTADELLEQIKEERLKYYEKQLTEWEEAVIKWESNGKQGKKPSKPRKPNFSEDVKLEEAKIDKIPASWCLTEIQNISDLVTDGTHHTPEYTNTGVKFISVKDIYEEVVHFDSCKYISEETHSELIKRCHPQKGDLLITKSGTIGRLAIVPDEVFSLFVSVASFNQL